MLGSGRFGLQNEARLQLWGEKRFESFAYIYSASEFIERMISAKKISYNFGF